MIRLRIPQLAKEKGIKHAHKAMVKGGISSAVAHDYLREGKERIVINHIEILCLVFRCTPNDLIECVPDKPAVADLTQPIYSLGPREDFDVEKELKKLTPEEIKRLFEEKKEK